MVLTENQCIVDSNYLTPVQYSHFIQTELKLDIYNILNMGTLSRIAPTYFTTLYGYCSSCNVSLDASSHARLSISLNMILADEIKDDFLVRPEGFVWYNSVLKITKIYKIYNDNTNQFDTHEVVFGYVFPNQNSFSYSAESRELSISGTDLISGISAERGGSMLHYMTEDWKAGSSFWNSEGITIYGNTKDTEHSFVYKNYLETMQARGYTEDQVSEMWKTAYDNLTYYNNVNGIVIPRQNEVNIDYTLASMYDWVTRLSQEYVTAFPLRFPYVNLYKANELLPHDLEFTMEVSLMDIYTEIIELYPNQTMYFDNLPRLCLEELPSTWCDNIHSCDYFARELHDLVISENISYDYNNLVNYIIVFGRDSSCCAKYMIRTGWQCPMTNCTNHDTIYTNNNGTCPVCGTTLEYVGDENELSVDRVGFHKKVIYSETYVTDEECYNAAKAECISQNRFNETTTITLADNYLPFLNRSELNVGRKIEYTSILTGETNVYTLQKMSNDFSSGTWDIELSRFKAIRDSDYECGFRLGTVLSIPSFTYTLSETGLLTLTISSGSDTQYSLYKVYMEVDSHFQETEGAVSKRNIFIGETCTTNDDNATKTFTYQFDSDGEYVIKCIAYNANFEASDFSPTQTITVDCFGRRVAFDTDSLLMLEDENYLLTS